LNFASRAVDDPRTLRSLTNGLEAALDTSSPLPLPIKRSTTPARRCGEISHKPIHHSTALPVLRTGTLTPISGRQHHPREGPSIIGKKVHGRRPSSGASGRPAELYVTDADQHFDVVVEMATSLLIGNPG
jgi:hypothetical protein